MNDGLYKVTVDGEVEVINPIEEELTKIHRDFLNDRDEDRINKENIITWVLEGLGTVVAFNNIF